MLRRSPSVCTFRAFHGLAKHSLLGSARKRVVVVGCGKVGRSIVHVLASRSDYEVVLADVDMSLVEQVALELPTLTKAFPRPTRTPEDISEAMQNAQCVISAAPSAVNLVVARCARDLGMHYVDVNEDKQNRHAIHSLASAEGVRSAFAPQCGIVPGLVTIAAAHVASTFDCVHHLTLRAGVLPAQPTNRLNLSLSGTTGEVQRLVEQYVNRCTVVRNHRVCHVSSLTGMERVIVDGVTYESFSTSADLEVFCKGAALARNVARLDFKTLRYPGHLELIQFLMDDMGFRSRPTELVQILQRALPISVDDFVLLSVRGLGTRGSEFVEYSWRRKVVSQFIGNFWFSGRQVASAATACCVVDVLLDGLLPQRGLVTLSDVDYPVFIDRTFGRFFSGTDHM